MRICHPLRRRPRQSYGRQKGPPATVAVWMVVLTGIILAVLRYLPPQ
jgi:hypothetical protein